MAGRPAQTYIQQLSEDTGCSPEDRPEAMNDRESAERGSGISVPAARHDVDDDDDTISVIVTLPQPVYNSIFTSLLLCNNTVNQSEK